MSTAELREIMASLALSQKDSERRMKETDRQMKDTDRRLKELGIQIGGLGNKFGSFTEGLSYRSLARILLEKFGMAEFIAPSVQVSRDGLKDEYDILAYTNGSFNQGMVVEIKSNLREEDIAQMKRKMDKIFHFLPAHRDKTFHGMIACVSGSAALKARVIKNGWYLVHIGDDLFELETPEGFVAKAYTAPSAG